MLRGETGSSVLEAILVISRRWVRQRVSFCVKCCGGVVELKRGGKV